MNPTGGPEIVYVRARKVLLDGIEALREHANSVVLVGAQAIYLHTGEGDLAVAPYTEDADLALDPRRLANRPLVEVLLEQAGFVPGTQPGSWQGAYGVPLDLLVPESLGGGGTRGARIPPHSERVARKARGLEAALVDRSPNRIVALDPEDARCCTVDVAGPGALLVAKLHKLADRQEAPTRLSNKDALDVYRLLRAISTERLAQGLSALEQTELSREVTRVAMTELKALFGAESANGVRMVTEALEPLEDPATVRVACTRLARRLLDRKGMKA